MNIARKAATVTVLALSINPAFASAATTQVEHHAQAFLNALNAGGGKSLELLN